MVCPGKSSGGRIEAQPTRAGQLIVEETGAWVTGYENNEELAQLGKQRSKMTGMTKRAPVNYSDFDTVKPKAKAFDTCGKQSTATSTITITDSGAP